MPTVDKKKPVIPDFIVLLFISSILLIDFLPYFKTMEIINPQFLYLSVINILLSVYFYFGPRDVLNEGLSLLKRSYLALLYLIFVFLCGLSVLAAKNISLVITNFTQIAIVFVLFINLTVLLKDKLALFYKIVLIVCISTFLQSFNELYNVALTASKSSVIEGLGQLKWNTGNINILAASLSIKLPFLIVGIFHFTGNKKWFISLTLLLATLTIILTGARSGLINMFLVFFIALFYHFKTKPFSKKVVLKSVAVLVPVVLSIFIANWIFKKNENNDVRYASVATRIEQIKTDDTSVQQRFLMWQNAITLTKDNPVLGIGLGNYRIESIPYESTKADDAWVSLHTHNDFLEIMSETGILNGLIYFSLFVFVFFLNLKRIIKSKDESTRVIALLVLLLVVVYGVDSTFNFPMYRPTMQIFLSILFALTVVNEVVTIKKDSILKVNANLPGMIIAISCLTFFSAVILFKASNLEYLIKSDDINANIKGVLSGDEVVKKMTLYPNVFGTSESFSEYAGIYYFREKRYQDAFRCFDKAAKINPYTGRVDFYRYLVFQEIQNMDSAYVYAKKAFYMKPRNSNFYQHSLNIASRNRDTLEITKETKLYTKYRKSSEAWKQSALALQTAGYSRSGLLRFIDEGLAKFPNDSILIRQKTDFKITDLIVEGQKYASEGKFDKSLQTYTKALNLDPGNIYAAQNIGFHYYNTGQYKQAISYFKQALEKPGLNDGHTEYYIAMSYVIINDLNNACTYFNLSKSKNYSLAQQQIDKNCK